MAKRKDYPAEWAELDGQLAHYKTVARGGDYQQRKERRKAFRDLLTNQGRDYSLMAVSGQRPQPAPTIPLMWTQVQMQDAKIFNGYLFKPGVKAEKKEQLDAAIQAQVARNRQALPPTVDESTYEASAAILTSICDYLYDKTRFLQRVKDATARAEWEEEAYLLTTYDDEGAHIDVLGPDDVGCDEEAKTQDAVRFFFYETRVPLSHIDQYHETYAHMVQPDRIEDAPGPTLAPLDSNRDHQNVTLECWYLRTSETKKKRIERVVTDIKGLDRLLNDGWENDDKLTVSQPVDAGNGVIDEMPVQWTVYQNIDVPRYRGGWKKVYRANGVILNDPSADEPFEVRSATGRLPLHHLPYYRVPGERAGMSICRQLMPLNETVNTMVAEGQRIVKSLVPRKGIVSGRLSFDSQQSITSGAPADFVYFKPQNDQIEAMQSIFDIPAGNLSPSYLELLRQNEIWLEMAGGGIDLRRQNTIPQNASGEFVRAVEDASNARISCVRDNVADVCKNAMLELLANELYFNSESKQYRIKTGGGEQYLDVIPAAFWSDDFERRYDIIVNAQPLLDKDPQTDNINKSQLIDLLTLGTPDEDLALGKLDVMQVDDKETIRAIVRKFWEKKKQATPPPSPEQLKMQEGAFADATDVYKKIADQFSDVNPVVSAFIAQELANVKNGKEINHQAIMQMVVQAQPALIAYNQLQNQPNPKGAIQ